MRVLIFKEASRYKLRKRGKASTDLGSEESHWSLRSNKVAMFIYLASCSTDVRVKNIPCILIYVDFPFRASNMPRTIATTPQAPGSGTSLMSDIVPLAPTYVERPNRDFMLHVLSHPICADFTARSKTTSAGKPASEELLSW